MKKATIVPCIILSYLLIGGCSSEQSGKGEKVTSAFAYSAEKCLLDVGDNKIPYQQSTYCTNLAGLHVAIVAAGPTNDFSKKAQNDYSGAFSSAWRAVALNNYNSAMGIKGWVPLDRVW